MAQITNQPVKEIYIPRKLRFLLTNKARYKIAFGGRGSAKSTSFALGLLIKAQQETLRILCARELQGSIADSVHKLLVDLITKYEFPYFHVTKTSIINLRTGSEFIFKGLKNNITSIQSMEGIDIVWIEEAQKVSEDSWDILIPTIRKEGSEIWISFNPGDKRDATYQRCISAPPPNALIAEVNYVDNKFFPEVLRLEMEFCKKNNYNKYLHIWLGQPKENSEAIIFKNKFRVESFEAPEKKFMFGGRFFFGADFGFSNDAATLIRSYIIGRKLYIDYEMFGVGIELRDLAKRYEDDIPESKKGKIYGDNSRPDTISHLKHCGFDIEGADKGKGSVEDGIEYLRNFEEIIVHPRCVNTIDEFNTYSFKVDKNTGEILRDIVDAKNHTIDAIRYGHCKYIKKKVSILDSLNTQRG